MVRAPARGRGGLDRGRRAPLPLLPARSVDGVSWTLSPVNAFCRNVTLTNGTVAQFARRERPKLIFDSTGAPTHLISGAAWGGATANGDATFTFIQPLGVQ